MIPETGRPVKEVKGIVGVISWENDLPSGFFNNFCCCILKTMSDVFDDVKLLEIRQNLLLIETEHGEVQLKKSKNEEFGIVVTERELVDKMKGIFISVVSKMQDILFVHKEVKGISSF